MILIPNQSNPFIQRLSLALADVLSPALQCTASTAAALGAFPAHPQAAAGATGIFSCLIFLPLSVAWRAGEGSGVLLAELVLAWQQTLPVD